MSQEFIIDIILGLIPRCKICNRIITHDDYCRYGGYCFTCEVICNDFPLEDEFEGCCENCFEKTDEFEDVWDNDEGKWIKVCSSCYVDCQMNGLEGE